jgi:hypothetical protein
MKVRHKVTGVEMEVMTPGAEKTQYYFGAGAILEKESWVPVPTETWRDVTSECDVQANCQLVHDDGVSIAQVTAKPYRLRLVPTHDLYMTNHPMAIIVEKRDVR